LMATSPRYSTHPEDEPCVNEFGQRLRLQTNSTEIPGSRSLPRKEMWRASSGRRCWQRFKLLQGQADRHSDGNEGWGMDLVPRLLGVALFALALSEGSGVALADGLMPGNGGFGALPSILPPSAQDSLLPNDDSFSSAAPSQKFGLQNGHFDFFSVQPESRSSDFTSLLRGGMGSGGGLKFQLNW